MRNRQLLEEFPVSGLGKFQTGTKRVIRLGLPERRAQLLRRHFTRGGTKRNQEELRGTKEEEPRRDPKKYWRFRCCRPN